MPVFIATPSLTQHGYPVHSLYYWYYIKWSVNGFSELPQQRWCSLDVACTVIRITDNKSMYLPNGNHFWSQFRYTTIINFCFSQAFLGDGHKKTQISEIAHRSCNTDFRNLAGCTCTIRQNSSSSLCLEPMWLHYSLQIIHNLWNQKVHYCVHKIS